ncbi:MAG: CoA-binding protein [Litorivicinus sp.]
MNEQAVIESMLQPGRHVAVLGVSWKPHRASYRVAERLIQAGLRVTLVNPSLASTQLFDRPVYATLADAFDAEGPLDWVDVFRGVEYLPGILDECLAVGAAGLWGQLEIIDQAVAERAQSAGMSVVMDRCPAIEMNRLGR